jgi:hypothetical protein
LVEFNVIHHLQSEGEITKEDVNAKKTNNAEVSQLAVERTLTILANNLPAGPPGLGRFHT